MNKLLKKALHKHQTGDARGAEDLYKKILRDAPHDVDGNYLLGALYAERGELERALKYTQRAAEHAPRSPFIQNNLGNIYRLGASLTWRGSVISVPSNSTPLRSSRTTTSAL